MSEKSPDTKETLSTFPIKEAASGLPFKEAYNDLIHPAAQAIGKMISVPFRSINVLLKPSFVWLAANESQINDICKAVSEKAKDIPKDKLVEPDTHIAVPALQALWYSMDSAELKKLYTNLLTKAINADEKDNIHPAYVEVIRQMAPLDAKLLSAIQSGGHTAIPLVNIRFQRKASPPWKDFKYIRGATEGYDILLHFANISGLDADPEAIAISLENLDRLVLIEISEEYKLVRQAYAAFETCSVVTEYVDEFASHELSETHEITLLPCCAKMTTFGKGFSAICL